jgi:Tol biopolymer transport system component
VIPSTGGTLVHILDMPGNALGLRWSPDQKSLQYRLTQNGATNVWELPIAGGAARQVTKFTAGRMFDFSWTRDGKHMLVLKGEVASDVVLISNFR